MSGDAVQALGSGITLDSPLAKGHRPARKSPLVQAILLQTNAERPQTAIVVPEFGAVLARYELEEMPDRDSTAASYESYIRKHIRPRWAEVPLDRITPMAVEDWLKRLALAPKTRSHIRSLMHTIFQCAQRWELVERNAIELVRIRAGASASSRHASLRRKSSSSCWP